MPITVTDLTHTAIVQIGDDGLPVDEVVVVRATATEAWRAWQDWPPHITQRGRWGAYRCTADLYDLLADGEGDRYVVWHPRPGLVALITPAEHAALLDAGQEEAA